MANARQFAEWIVRYRADSGAPVDRLSLQKLLFYAQAFHLARHGEPLFPEAFEAWVHGPVLPQVWRALRGEGDRTILPGDERAPLQLDEESEASLRDTVQFFSRFNRFSVSEATHQEEPWRIARSGRAPDEPSGALIPLDAIRRYYANLIADGELALSRREALHRVPEPRIGMYYRSGICSRKMVQHPFYDMALAEFLEAPAAAEAPVPEAWYAPLRTSDVLSADDL